MIRNSVKSFQCLLKTSMTPAKESLRLKLEIRQVQRFSNGLRLQNHVIDKNKVLTIENCKQLRTGIRPEYVGSAHSKLHNIVWNSPLQNVYVVKKPWNTKVRDATLQFIKHVQETYPAVNIIVNEDVADEFIHETNGAGPSSALLSSKSPDGSSLAKTVIYTGAVEDIVSRTDLIVTIGGDGTILRAVGAFANSSVPPVLSFAMGTLGFLLPFDFTKFAETFKMVYESRSKAMNRSRLECHVVRHSRPDTTQEIQEDLSQYEADHYKQHHLASMQNAINDIFLHRGSQPHLTSLDIFIDNEFLTTTTGDGITLATPTGSTAYSLSAGGSISHPLVPCIILTPVCPRSLSFRPLILPATSHVMVRLSKKNRNRSIKLSVDGVPQQELRPGDEMHVVSESGTIFIPGKHDPPPFLASKTDFDEVISPGQGQNQSHGPEVFVSSNVSGRDKNQKGLWCVARSESDWTKDLNELLGFNSSFRPKF